MNIFQQVLDNPSAYCFDVDRLGECSIDSPLGRGAYIQEHERALITSDLTRLEPLRKRNIDAPSFEKAGPRAKIFHDPAWSRAAIVTCGGLCPGLNDVIKGIVLHLNLRYGVRSIFGIRYGYRGLIPSYGHSPMPLNPDVVDQIHEDGGTILGSSRGEQSTSDMVDTLQRMHINMLFCIGGDGTMRAARKIAEETMARKLAISVVGVPKTIDNDLHFVGRTFGFETAIYATSPVITSAHMEAKGSCNGIGLVKLMGRDSGFVAAFASLANSVVNFCLIPEVDFEMDGEHGLLKAVERRFRSGKDHAVIVVAEGAGQKHMGGGEAKRDASGNVLKRDIGHYLKTRLEEYLAGVGIDTSIKYFDPSYSIRSVAARGTDAILCCMLAFNAVHAAMAGRTNCVIGHSDDVFMHVPIALSVMERQKIDVTGDLWKAVLDSTGQNVHFHING